MPNRITVLMSPAGQRNSNSPIHALVSHLPGDIEVVPFSWRKAFIGRYEILHVHWPESLLRSSGAIKKVGRRVVFAALVLLNLARARPGVWTVHNASPHESGGRLESAVFQLWSRAAKARIYLFPSAMPTADPRAHHIPFGTFQQVLEENPDAARPPREEDRVLSFGVLRPYKGIEDLIAVARTPKLEGTYFRIVGRPADSAYASMLAGLADEAENVSLEPRLVAYDELITEISRATVVVLPYKNMYNSGAALLAATVGRTILVRDSPTMRDLQAEIGPEFVRLFDGELTAEDVHGAMEVARRVPDGIRPDMSRREWPRVGEDYASLYRGLAGLRAETKDVP